MCLCHFKNVYDDDDDDDDDEVCCETVEFQQQLLLVRVVTHTDDSHIKRSTCEQSSPQLGHSQPSPRLSPPPPPLPP